MSEPKLDTAAPMRAAGAPVPLDRGAAASSRRLLAFGVAAIALSLAFISPLFEFIRFGLDKDRNTYLLLIPFISGYLIWIKRAGLPRDFKTDIVPALIPGVVALAALWASFSAAPSAQRSLYMLSYLAFLLTAAFLILGARPLKEITFPIAFLIFAIPIPTPIVTAIEVFLQYTSAEAAYGMLSMTPTPINREGLIFRLPNIQPIYVAQECSGFNSTWVLFIVSILASHLFLKSITNRFILSFFVIPLAILRNGFRITTIALLCVYVNPNMIDSMIHHHGGPIFFALSLIPFLLLLWFLRKRDARQKRAKVKL